MLGEEQAKALESVPELGEELANGFLSALPARSLSVAQLKQLSPEALAYIGDAVYELYVRMRYLFPPRRLQTYHNQVVNQVRAETQARHLEVLKSFANATESDVIRRGRNAASSGSKRVNAQVYQQATSLEALIGYLYLSDPRRLSVLLAQLDFALEETD